MEKQNTSYAQIAKLRAFVYKYFIDVWVPETKEETVKITRELVALEKSGELKNRKDKKGKVLMKNGIMLFYGMNNTPIHGSTVYGEASKLSVYECEKINQILELNLAKQLPFDELKKSIPVGRRELLIRDLEKLVISYKIKVDINKTDEELVATLQKIRATQKKERTNREGELIYKGSCLMFEEKKVVEETVVEKPKEKGIVVDGIRFQSIWDEI